MGGAEAMSYFVGGKAVEWPRNGVVESGYDEDAGFAINCGKGWSKVVFQNHQVDLNGDTAVAMGNYFFTCATTGNEDSKVRIFLHHSSIPFVHPVAASS